MDIPPQILIDESIKNPTVRDVIEHEIAKLEQFHPHITSCRVAVTAPQKRHHTGGLFEVRISIHIPKHREVVINHLASEKLEQEHIGVAVREAFAKARRQLQDGARIQQGITKSHEAPPHGQISKLFPIEGYGIIQASDGSEIYFHRNSLVDAEFDKLKVGVEVRYVETEGERGPQASTVHLVGKHHIV